MTSAGFLSVRFRNQVPALHREYCNVNREYCNVNILLTLKLSGFVGNHDCICERPHAMPTYQALLESERTEQELV